MAYLSIRSRHPGAGGQAAIDFTVHELIPLVRHITRYLETVPEVSSHLPGYRVRIRPCYDASPQANGKILLPKSSQPPPDRTAVLKLSEADIQAAPPLTYADEINAYFNTGPDGLCRDCPERHRCPGALDGSPTRIDDWIICDDFGDLADPVSYFELRFESSAGIPLYEQNGSVTMLQPFLDYASRELDLARRFSGQDQGRWPLVDIIARRNGELDLDPRLSAPRRRSVYRVEVARPTRLQSTGAQRNVLGSSMSHAPADLVEWDKLSEQSAPPPEIKVLDSQVDRPIDEAAPQVQGCELVGEAPDPDVYIWVRRTLLQRLADRGNGSRLNRSGVLIGTAGIDSGEGFHWLDITSILPFEDTAGRSSEFTLAYESYSRVLEQKQERFPDEWIVGWYHLRATSQFEVVLADTLSAVFETGAPALMPTHQETFLHQNFFCERWQVALLIDPKKPQFRFFVHAGSILRAARGFFLRD